VCTVCGSIPDGSTNTGERRLSDFVFAFIAATNFSVPSVVQQWHLRMRSQTQRAMSATHHHTSALHPIETRTLSIKIFVTQCNGLGEIGLEI
jgi:hypothetical protein